MKKLERACVIVLGDIGRSPRMQYHVKSLSENDFLVDVVGYVETKPLDDLIFSPNVKIHQLNQFPDSNLPNKMKYIFKTIWQTLSLLLTLFSLTKPKFILCQNPPAIPTLFVTYFYCLIMRSQLIIDWHNYTHTILALTSSPSSLIVRLAKFIESHFGRKATGHFCVTKAMQEDLKDNWGIEATVLYDRPPAQFHPINVDKKHELFNKLSLEYIEFASKDGSESTAFTKIGSKGYSEMNEKRPGLLISSTSWTPDEDFSTLLMALEIYEEEANKNPLHYPKLICAITGKGPQKDHYKQIISEKDWKFVSIITPWLENEDYPLLLASADLGVCLHWSSSGLDLPMKVVDMFGCGLPVCAIDFKCLGELVQNGKNGFVFRNSKELASRICEWFYDFPTNIALANLKEEFQRNLKQFQTLRWTENWKKNALPLFK